MTSPFKTVALSFGGGPPNEECSYRKRVLDLGNECKASNFFDEIILKTDQDLILDEEFWSEHGEFMLNPNNRRGFGFWLWKPYIIKKSLEALNDNDILVYLDAGCTLNHHGNVRFKDYQEMLAKNNFGVLAFQLYACNDDEYSKRNLLEYMNATQKHKTTPQIIATVVMFKKTPLSMEFVNEWYRIASKYNLINDDTEGEYSTFRDHRHDQSIFSLLVKRYRDNEDTGVNCKPIIIPDETYFPNDWHGQGRPYPFWGTRIR